MLQELTQLGLSAEEATVYLAILQLGGSGASEIAKLSKKNRATTYHTLQNLQELGLVSKVNKRGRQFFSPANPQALVNRATQQLDVANSLLPELLSVLNNKKAKPKVRFFEGISGIETVMNDTLSAKSEILGYTNLALLAEIFPGYFRRYNNERMRKGVKVRYLSPRPNYQIPNQGLAFLEEFLPESLNLNLIEILFIDPEQFPFRNEIAIYDNKVALMTLSKEEQIGLLVESESVATTMQAIFNLAWLGASNFAVL